MAIVSSSFTLDGHAQVNGDLYVREQHTDHLGVVHVREYLAAPGVNHAAMLANYAVELVEILRDKQERENLDKNSIVDWVFDHLTVSQMQASLRRAYRDATKFEAARLARFVNELTQAQVRTIFGVDNTTATAIKNKASSLTSQYNALTIASGD